MENQINSNKKLQEKFESLQKELQAHMQENSHISSLELHCTTLRKTIIQDELGLPSVISFKHHFSQLEKLESVEYILTLLHECWTLVYPDYLFDSELKDESEEDLLEKSLSKYSDNYNDGNGSDNNDKDCSSYNCKYAFTEDFNSPYKIIISSAYYRKMTQNKNIIVYREYLQDLHGILSNICKASNYSLTESFVLFACIESSLSRKELGLLFDALATGSKKYMKNDKETKQTFLSLFKNTLLIRSQKIQWLDVNPKTCEPAISSLYTLFSAIGVDMNTHNKDIICQFFNDANGNTITSERLKPRNQSKNLQNIINIVNNIRNTP